VLLTATLCVTRAIDNADCKQPHVSHGNVCPHNNFTPHTAFCNCSKLMQCTQLQRLSPTDVMATHAVATDSPADPPGVAAECLLKDNDPPGVATECLLKDNDPTAVTPPGSHQHAYRQGSLIWSTQSPHPATSPPLPAPRNAASATCIWNARLQTNAALFGFWSMWQSTYALCTNILPSTHPDVHSRTALPPSTATSASSSRAQGQHSC